MSASSSCPWGEASGDREEHVVDVRSVLLPLGAYEIADAGRVAPLMPGELRPPMPGELQPLMPGELQPVTPGGLLQPQMPGD